MNGDKPFWKSKTLWVNAITVVGGFVAKALGVEFGGDDAAVVLGFVNLALRLVTKGAVTLT